MKKVIRYSLYLLKIIVLLLVAFISYVSIFLPNVGPPPEINVEINDEKVARGQYLANHVMLCMDCHANRDWTLFAGRSLPIFAHFPPLKTTHLLQKPIFR